jgi:5-methylcytosine-specific restriction endonuclease McrA
VVRVLQEPRPCGASATWPTTGPTSSWLPNVGRGVGAGAGTTAGIGAGAFLGGLRNASMGAYWSRVPGTQAMPTIWVYELEKRVRAGTLSREDAIGIFSTAVLGAQAQGFKPTGDRMSLVHKSATDFLGNAEAVYFAKKKKAADAAADAHAGHDANAPNANAPAERVTGEELDRRRREFDKMRSEIWKEEARRNPEKYSHEQLQQMQQGKVPKGSDGEPMEIHHTKPLSEGGTNTWDNFEIMTHTAHRRKPNFKPNHPNLPRGRSK